jgi:hypothetical protein
MKAKYKSKMRQKQRIKARGNRAESKESNKPKINVCGTNDKVTETSGVTSEPGVASINSQWQLYRFNVL